MWNRLWMVVVLMSAVFAAGSGVPAFAQENQPRVALLLWRGMTRAEEGFLDRLSARSVDARVKVFNARQDLSRLDDILENEFRPEDFDYVYTFGTTLSTRTARYLKGRVPQIFNIVSYPVQAGLVKSMGGSGKSISGVSNVVSLPSQLNYARTILKFKRVGVLFTPQEENACFAVNVLEDTAREQGIKVVRFPAGPGEAGLKAALKAVTDPKAGVDLVWLPTESRVTSQGKMVADALKAAKLPSIAAVESLVEDGALLGLAPRYYDLGAQAADMLYENLSGKPLGDMPVGLPRFPRPVINMQTARALDVDIYSKIAEEAVVYE